MEDVTRPHMKTEHSSPYGHHHHHHHHHQHHPPPPPPAVSHHLSATETSALHNYPHPPPPHSGAAMPTSWNPTPSPYNEGGGEHRHSHPDAHPPHHSSYPPHPPPHYTGPPPSHVVDGHYNRHGSTSAPSRSPPSAQPPHQYPPPPVNGSAPHTPYYPPQPPPDYRDRPPYALPAEGQPNGSQPPPLQVSTSHDMMSGQPQSAPPMGYGHTHGPPSAGPAPGTPYASAWGPGGYDAVYPRRKPVRAAQACDPCRQRKAKCDEGRPTCTHCKDNNLACTYRDIPPQKNEKHALAIQDKLDNLGTQVERMLEHWKGQELKLDRLINFSESQAHRLTAVETALPDFKHHLGDRTPTANSIHASSDPEPHAQPSSRTASSTSLHGPTGMEKPRDQRPGEDRKATNSTAAANLLAWPVIKKLIPRDQTTSYVMDTESTRGLLRLYGSGEGEDRTDGYEGASSPATSSSSGRLDEDVAGASPSGVWGTARFLPPSHTSAGGSREHPGGLGPYGGLHFESDTVDRYHHSYLENMYKLHPFLEKQVLRKMVTAFKAKYSWDYRITQRVASSIGIKRKREGSDSPNSLPDDYASAQQPRTQPRHVAQASVMLEHSVSNAIILLVLALGKICAYKDPLPGPVQSGSARLSVHPSVYSDLPMTTSASAPTSPHAGSMSMNGGTPLPHPSASQGRNMDVIPGLAYFSKAADILGEMPGGVDVPHVQANLLAGLYMGQLGRILPSHWFIRNACMACLVLINSTPYKEKKISPARRNLINFAFWSCLQLESDILAEMDLPPSGIVSKEGEMLYEKPAHLTLYDAEGVDSNRVIEEHRHYSYQIGLRKILNDSLFHIYRENREGDLPPKSVIAAFGAYLQDFRRVLGDWDWDDDDHESNDINMARLRGKYFGAKYVIHRPALYYALNFLTPSSNAVSRPIGSPATVGSNSEFPSPAVGNGQDTSRRSGSMRPPPLKTWEPLEPWILEASQHCVHAAIRSTTAFDRVPPRMIITNIFGTAHAQFGNVLVLAATFCSAHPQLRCLIEESKLRFLMDRTIKFLQKHEAISPTLGKDAIILQHVQSKVFNIPYYPSSAASSFSSNR